MILDLVYTSKDFYISNQVKWKLIYLLFSLIILSLYAQDLYYLIYALTFLDDKADILQKRSPSNI